MPASLTILRSQPFCVMKAKPPGGPRHCAMHCHRPLKFAPCADAPDAAKVADSTIAVNKAFMVFLLHNPTGFVCRLLNRLCYPCRLWVSSGKGRLQFVMSTFPKADIR